MVKWVPGSAVSIRKRISHKRVITLPGVLAWSRALAMAEVSEDRGQKPGGGRGWRSWPHSIRQLLSWERDQIVEGTLT